MFYEPGPAPRTSRVIYDRKHSAASELGFEDAPWDALIQASAWLHLSGYEVNYDQQLRMLPRPFNTLAVFANYTRVHTSGTYDNGITDLTLFIPKVFNVGFTHDTSLVRLRWHEQLTHPGVCSRG